MHSTQWYTRCQQHRRIKARDGDSWLHSPVGMDSSVSWNFLICLPIDLAYWFHFHLCYNQLISVCVLNEEKSGTVIDVDLTFIFIAQKIEDGMVKWKLHPEQKQPHYAANTILTLCKHLHREHASTKLAKKPKWCYSWVNADQSPAAWPWTSRGYKQMSSHMCVPIRIGIILVCGTVAYVLYC